jgi:hypothetical protein
MSEREMVSFLIAANTKLREWSWRDRGANRYSYNMGFLKKPHLYPWGEPPNAG